MEKLQVIGVAGSFPGPIVNVTTNWNVVVNVRNHLDEPLLFTWYGLYCLSLLLLLDSSGHS
jgi:Multicopper oxidase